MFITAVVAIVIIAIIVGLKLLKALFNTDDNNKGVSVSSPICTYLM